MPDISADELDRLATSMDSDGYAVLRNCIPEHEIEKAAQFVLTASVKHNGEYFSYNGPGSGTGTLMDDLGQSTVFRRIVTEIYERAVGQTAPPHEIHQALRVVVGKSGLEKAWKFHYDTYVITALVPVVIPSKPGVPHGDLIIYPRLRAIRRTAIRNLIDKITLQNRAMCYCMASAPVRRLLKARVMRLDPGNIYFFRGYESLHGNEPCPPDLLRCTALFHFADPHENSTLHRFIRDRRQRGRRWNSSPQEEALS